MDKKLKYKELLKRIDSLIKDEEDYISKMSTIACEIFQSFDHFNWVGFYRLVNENILKVGPYQGTHGCLTIDINKGVCGKCVREKKVQIENDVNSIPHHIECSSDTKSEIVIPVFDKIGNLIAVLDIDSIKLNCFDSIDEKYLTIICANIY
ncbi:GAF domain-containing protein [bacterium]|nr:GAF domain-containing protein [bacterium]